MSDDNKQPPGGDEDRTVFAPQGGQPSDYHQTTPPSGYTQGSFQTHFAPREVGQGIQVGDVLNHIFEVKRFIARGGMGEVFEGANVNSEERVAIKVMLPSLAADPNVIAMFRKEARTLTRLNHEGLVSYRVLAQEPQLGVLYIVTEYIDGVNLADALGTLSPTPEQMVQMLRRLAAGLRAAHALGAIHRDMSPDNVILEDGEITKAKVIDFGIAKDLDPGSKTIVGDGFAGKLNYVAPEQLGDFDREVGPWTDIYSLGLVMLAVAQGRNVQMGGSLVDAVDKRRAGPDLSGVPDALRPVLEKMLKPNPQERLRSMDAVLDALGDRRGAGAGGEAPAAPASKLPLAIGGGLGVVALAVIGWLTLGHKEAGRTGGGSGPAITAVEQKPVDVARSAIDATLPSVACTWLSVSSIKANGKTVDVALNGVAGNPSAAQNEISRALDAQKLNNANINFEEVAPITQSGCAALDTYRQIRAPEGHRLTVPQRSFEMRVLPAGNPWAGRNAASAIITMAIGDPKLDLAVVGLEPSGVISDIVTSREMMIQQKASFTNLGSDKYRLQLDIDHKGWSGILLLTGKGPFEKEMVAPPLGARGPDWREKFVSLAAANGWQADMVWFKTVDDKAGD